MNEWDEADYRAQAEVDTDALRSSLARLCACGHNETRHLSGGPCLDQTCASTWDRPVGRCYGFAEIGDDQ